MRSWGRDVAGVAATAGAVPPPPPPPIVCPQKGKQPPSPSLLRLPPPRRRTTSRCRRCVVEGMRDGDAVDSAAAQHRTRGCGRDDDACVRNRDARGAPCPILPPPFFFSFPFLPPPSSPPPHRLYYNMVFFYFFGIGGKNRGGAGRGSLANFPSIQHKGCT